MQFVFVGPSRARAYPEERTLRKGTREPWGWFQEYLPTAMLCAAAALGQIV